MNFKNKFARFMYGRYGIDELYSFFLLVYVLFVKLNIFLKSKYIIIIEILILFIMFYRVFSKKIYKRSNENKLYLKLKNNILRPFRNIKRNIKDKDNIYKKCSKCKRILKLSRPYKSGIKHVKCPKCGKRLSVIVFKKQKVEIIRNK